MTAKRDFFWWLRKPRKHVKTWNTTCYEYTDKLRRTASATGPLDLEIFISSVHCHEHRLKWRKPYLTSPWANLITPCTNGSDDTTRNILEKYRLLQLSLNEEELNPFNETEVWWSHRDLSRKNEVSSGDYNESWQAEIRNARLMDSYDCVQETQKYNCKSWKMATDNKCLNTCNGTLVDNWLELRNNSSLISNYFLTYIFF